MFNKDHLSDVKFAVQKANGETGIIAAHKFVLSISSPVFENMFYGEDSAAADVDSIELRDCEIDSFLEILRFCYSDEVKLNARNVVRVSVLAKSFALPPSLTDKCSRFISDNLEGSNVFNILLNFARHVQFAPSSQLTVLDKRQPISLGNLHRFCRFASANGLWKYDSIAKDSIILSADSDVLLRGLCLFGSENSSYSIALQVNEVDSYSALGCNIRGGSNRSQRQSSVVSVAKLYGTFPSRLTMSNFYVVELLFDFGIVLKRNAWYCLEAVISGPSSLRGEGGYRVVQCLGAKFTFRDSYKDTNGTRVTSGQFPELLFYLMPPVHTKEGQRS